MFQEKQAGLWHLQGLCSGLLLLCVVASEVWDAETKPIEFVCSKGTRRSMNIAADVESSLVSPVDPPVRWCFNLALTPIIRSTAQLQRVHDLSHACLVALQRAARHIVAKQNGTSVHSCAKARSEMLFDPRSLSVRRSARRRGGTWLHP